MPDPLQVFQSFLNPEPAQQWAPVNQNLTEAVDSITASVGNPLWMNTAIPEEDRVADFLRVQASRSVRQQRERERETERRAQIEPRSDQRHDLGALAEAQREMRNLPELPAVANWEQIEPELRRYFPNAQATPEQFNAIRRNVNVAQSLSQAIQEMRGRDVWSGYEIGRDVEERLPFVGGVVSTARALNVRDSANRLSSGEFSREDVNNVARYLVEAQESGDRTFLEQAGNIVSHLPAFAIEFLSTSGAFTAGRGLAAAGARTATGTAARHAVGATTAGLARQGAGALVGSGLQALAMPHRVAESAAQRSIPGMDIQNGQFQTTDRGSFLSQLPAGFLDTWIEVGTERAGGMLPGRAGGTGVAASLRNLGYHGIVGELFEERLGEALRGAAGLTLKPDGSRDFGAIQGLFDGRFRESSQQLLAETMAFAAVPVAHAAASRAMQSRGLSAANAMQQLRQVEAALTYEGPGISRERAEQIVNEVATNADVRRYGMAYAQAFPETPSSQAEVAPPQPGAQAARAPVAQVEQTQMPGFMRQGAQGQVEQPQQVTPTQADTSGVGQAELPVNEAVAGSGIPGYELRDVTEPPTPAVQTSAASVVPEVTEQAPSAQASVPATQTAAERIKERSAARTKELLAKPLPGYAAKEFSPPADPQIAAKARIMLEKKLTGEPIELEAVANFAGLTGIERHAFEGATQGANLPDLVQGSEKLRDPKDPVKGPYSEEGIRQAKIRAMEKTGADDALIERFLEQERATNAERYQKGEAGDQWAAEKTDSELKAMQGALKADEVGISEINRLHQQLERLKANGKDTPEKRQELERRLEQAHDRAKKRSDAGRKVAKGSDSESEGEPQTLFHEPGVAAPPAPAAPTGNASGVGVHDVVRDQAKIIGGPTYLSDVIPGSETALAVAKLKELGIIALKMAAGNPYANLEDQIHLWAWKNGFKGNPVVLEKQAGKAAVEGFRQFFAPDAPLSTRSIYEGFAQWFIRRSTRNLDNLTHEQQQANEYAEKFLAEKGFTKKADQVRDLYDSIKGQTPVQQAAGLLSRSEKPVEPMAIQDYWTKVKERVQDDWFDRLAVLKRTGMHKAYTIFSRLTAAEPSLARRFSEEGVGTIREGKWTTIGPSDAKIAETLTPELLAPASGQAAGFFDDKVSHAELFATARSVVEEHDSGVTMEAQGKDMVEAGEKLIHEGETIKKPAKPPKYQPAEEREFEARQPVVPPMTSAESKMRQRTAKQLESKEKVKPRKLPPLRPFQHGQHILEANRRIEDGKAMIKQGNRLIEEGATRQNVVAPEQLEVFRAALEQYKANPKNFQLLTTFADRLTEGFNATLMSLSEPDIHMLSREKVLQSIAGRKYYLPLQRVKSKGTKGTGFLEKRKGSGEQIVSPLVSYQKRLRVTASLLAKQIKGNYVDDYLSQPGFADVGMAMEQTITPEGQEKLDKIAEVLGMQDADVADILREMGGGQALLFATKNWSPDGSQNMWHHHGAEGKLKSYIIKNQALYELLHNLQGDTNALAQAFHWISRMNIPYTNIKPVSGLADIQRLTATSLSPAFIANNAFNPMRDFLTFVSQSSDPLSGKTLAGAAKGYGLAFWRVGNAEWRVLNGKTPVDEVMNLFLRERGRALHQFAAEDILQGRAGLIGKIIDGFKQSLNVAGSGELAPRFVEFMNRMEQLGWSEARLREELKKAREAPGEYQDPVPWEVLQDAVEAAHQVTHPWGTKGIVASEIDSITPFFSPALQASYKYMRNWKENPKMAAVGLGIYLTFRMLHWAMFHDEEWYKELSAFDRIANFVVPINGKLYSLRGTQGVPVAVGGTMLASLDAAQGRDPRFADLLSQSIGSVAPPGVDRVADNLVNGRPAVAVGHAFGIAGGPAGNVTVDLLSNRGFGGAPIVPRGKEDEAASYQIPYALRQFSGGRIQPDLTSALGLNFGREVHPHQTVNDYYARLHELETTRATALRAGRRFEGQAEYARLHAVEEQMRNLNREMRGEVMRNGRIVPGTPPTPERAAAIRARQLALAQLAMSR